MRCLIRCSEFRKYPYIGYYKAFSPGVVALDADLIKDILIKDQAYFYKNELTIDEDSDDIMAKNPFVLSGDKWKSARAVLSPLFTLNRCKTLFPLMSHAGDGLKRFIKEKGPNHVFDAKIVSIIIWSD